MAICERVYKTQILPQWKRFKKASANSLDYMKFCHLIKEEELMTFINNHSWSPKKKFENSNVKIWKLVHKTCSNPNQKKSLGK